jgi:hypothetical protein
MLFLYSKWLHEQKNITTVNSVTNTWVSHEGKYFTKFLNQYSFICNKFYKLHKYNINISHEKTTGLRNSLKNLNVNYMWRQMYGNGYQWIPKMKIKEANLFNTVGCCILKKKVKSVIYLLFSYQTGYIMWHSRLMIYIPFGVTSYFMYRVLSHEGKYCTKFRNQYSFICSKFYKLYKH